MLKFFQKTPAAALPDLSILGIDLHSHLLPGIDDGAPDLKTALQLIRALHELGYRQIYTTPHVMSDFYPNGRRTILKKKEEVLNALEPLGLDLKFGAAAEYYLEPNFANMLKSEPLLTLPGNRVLVEMSFHRPYSELHRIIFDLQMKGYQPILAHPERYPYYNKAEDYETLKSIGCALQLNLLSLSGYYGKSVQTAAKTILNLGLVDFIGTDLHHARHVENLQEALSHEAIIDALQNHTFKNHLLQTD